MRGGVNDLQSELSSFNGSNIASGSTANDYHIVLIYK